MSQCIFIPPGPYTMTELSKQLKSGREEGEMKGKTEGARKGERMDLQGSRQKGDSERGKEEKSQERGEEREGEHWTVCTVRPYNFSKEMKMNVYENLINIRSLKIPATYPEMRTFWVGTIHCSAKLMQETRTTGRCKFCGIQAPG